MKTTCILRNPQTYENITETHKRMRTFTETHKRMRTFTETHKRVRTFTETHKRVRTFTETHKRMRTFTETHKRVRTFTETHKRMRTFTETHKRVRAPCWGRIFKSGSDLPCIQGLERPSVQVPEGGTDDATTTEHTPGTESLESQISNVEGRVEVHENDGNMEEQTGNINNDSNTEKDESINEKDDGNTEKDESINEKDDGNTEKDESINEKDDGNTEKECRNEKDRTKNTDYSKIELTPPTSRQPQAIYQATPYPAACLKDPPGHPATIMSLAETKSTSRDLTLALGDH
nr:uncharacterized protein LOC123764647 [Procambarus clarkii]